MLSMSLHLHLSRYLVLDLAESVANQWMLCVLSVFKSYLFQEVTLLTHFY